MSQKPLTQKLIAAALLLVLALVSFFPLTAKFSSRDFHQSSIELLDEKKITVVELTAATAIGSTALAMVPGDATSPIANQIAELSSYLMLIAGAIMLEKFLLTLTGLAAFHYLIPLACGLAILSLFLGREAFRKLAIKLTLFALAIFLVIPVSLRVSGLFEETFHSQETIDQAVSSLEEEEEATGEKAPLFNKAETSPSLKERAQRKLSSVIDSVATLIISNCAIPVLTLMFFLWLTKAIWGLTIPLPKKGALKQLKHAPSADS